MITTEILRERIQATGAWKDIIAAMELKTTPEELSKLANEETILQAFGEGSVKSKSLRDKLHRHPFPDIEKLGVYSDYSLEYHVRDGLTHAIALTEKAKKHNNPFELSSNILDFGCGTSRILRYMIEFLPGPQYYATEVFDKNIEWGRRAFPEIRYLHQSNHPPLDFPDGKFDIIYAYSIFTHFEENLHLRWLSELHRILKDRGLIILTIHGEPVLRRCKAEKAVREAMCVQGQNYRKLRKRFYKYGYAFYTCYDRANLSKGGLDPDIFGITYISNEYMQKNWSRKFQILEHDEGAIINWQDWVVMRKL